MDKLRPYLKLLAFLKHGQQLGFHISVSSDFQSVSLQKRSLQTRTKQKVNKVKQSVCFISWREQTLNMSYLEFESSKLLLVKLLF